MTIRQWAAALAFVISGPAAAVDVGDSAPRTPFLANLQGRVVYVDFWASWCVPCRLSMPALDDLYKKNRARGFEVVGVNKDVSAEDAARFAKRVSVSFPWVGDAQDAAARAFDVKAMPSGYLLDRKGVVRKVHRGFTQETAAALDQEIESLLKEPS